jgi:hypothetical protein
VPGLVASYAVFALLLLSLNLKSAWHWRGKAAAIALTAGFFVVGFVALEALLGWPTEAPPPARFQLHAALVLEPDRAPVRPARSICGCRRAMRRATSPGRCGLMPCPIRAPCTNRPRAPRRA